MKFPENFPQLCSNFQSKCCTESSPNLAFLCLCHNYSAANALNDNNTKMSNIRASAEKNGQTDVLEKTTWTCFTSLLYIPDVFKWKRLSLRFNSEARLFGTVWSLNSNWLWNSFEHFELSGIYFCYFNGSRKSFKSSPTSSTTRLNVKRSRFENLEPNDAKASKEYNLKGRYSISILYLENKSFKEQKMFAQCSPNSLKLQSA